MYRITCSRDFAIVSLLNIADQKNSRKGTKAKEEETSVN